MSVGCRWLLFGREAVGLGKLKRALGKTLSAVAVIGVAAVGVAAVLTVGSVIARKKESGLSSPESEVSDSSQTDMGVVSNESQAPGDRDGS